MTREPRSMVEYGDRETRAARRVLVDLGQVLAAFKDSIVVVGGWVPELLLSGIDPAHSGSIDVDLALDVEKLRDGRYTSIPESLLATRRYRKTEKAFALETTVVLEDGGPPVVVGVDFLKPPGRLGRGTGSRRTSGFRPLDADGCAAAFRNPTSQRVEGKMISGAENTVNILVASIEDFLIMKAHALQGRDKPKDAYDICYCLDHFPGGMAKIVENWRGRREENAVARAIEYLTEKFQTLASFGPSQVVEFYSPSTAEEEMIRQRAYQLVSAFLRFISI